MKKISFNEWLELIPVGRYLEVRKNILKRCGITENTYRNWKNKRSDIPFLAKKEINKIAEELNLRIPFEL